MGRNASRRAFSFLWCLGRCRRGRGGDLDWASLQIATFGFSLAVLAATEQTAVTQCLRTSLVLLALRW